MDLWERIQHALQRAHAPQMQEKQPAQVPRPDPARERIAEGIQREREEVCRYRGRKRAEVVCTRERVHDDRCEGRVGEEEGEERGGRGDERFRREAICGHGVDGVDERVERGMVLRAGEAVDGEEEDVERACVLGEEDDAVIGLGIAAGGRGVEGDVGVEVVVGEGEELSGVDVEDNSIRGEEDEIGRDGQQPRAGPERGGDRNRGVFTFRIITRERAVAGLPVRRACAPVRLLLVEIVYSNDHRCY